MGQAEQPFAMLKKLRNDVLFVPFPDETHGLSRSGKSRHRLARFAFILDWVREVPGLARG
jgi:dipeptidyl aminopeptidase/acylaminoacyl peptidase